MINRVAIAFTVCALAPAAWGQAPAAYPSKPIRFIIPFPPGASTNDILGRAMAQRLSEALGQQIIVDNRPGAGGTLGTELGAKATPDGYTIVGGTNGPIAISPHLYSKLPYNSLTDLAPVTLYAIVPYAIVAHPSVKANNVNELIALAKAQPGKLSYASAGNGSAPHLCMELFKSVTGTDIAHIPYKGGAPASIDVLAGQVQLYCPGLTSVLQHIKSGRMKPIVVTMAKRTPFLPEVSTSSEQGHPALQVNSWVGILAPAKTPAAIVNRLHAEIAKAMATEEMKKVITNNGAEPVALGPREFSEFLRSEWEKWGKVAKAAKLQID
jgi:tripartite-type tricarboxylate transporter receptor subunit TctC